MSAARFRLSAALAPLVALALAGSGLAGWDAGRATSPETVDEFKELQEQVKATHRKVQPSTVGLLVGNGAGSGVIVSDDGLILTAAHVIGRPGVNIKVVLADGKMVNGKSLGLNSKLDSGMAKITDKVPAGATWPGAAEGKWPKAELGTAAALKKGQWVMSLGHHGGPKRDRTPPLRVGRFQWLNKPENFLRSDCTLVGGDSGGPLFDLDGKVVGIHSKIGLFLEQNMHIPVEAFQDEWEKLSAGDDIGKLSASLGAEFDTEIDAPTVLTPPRGRGGLKVGDVITKFERKPIKTRADLKAAVAKCRAGEEVDLEVTRNGETVELTITLVAAGRGKK